MRKSEPTTTIVSTKGQIILPKAIRELRRWRVGTRLTVEDTEDGILLNEAPLFAAKTCDEVFGSLAYKGKAKTVEEMNASIVVEAKRRHAGH
jgi:AbrB family looped-hinge helix DNA binding protein